MIIWLTVTGGRAFIANKGYYTLFWLSSLGHAKASFRATLASSANNSWFIDDLFSNVLVYARRLLFSQNISRIVFGLPTAGSVCVFRPDMNTNYETFEHKHQNI